MNAQRMKRGILDAAEFGENTSDVNQDFRAAMFLHALIGVMQVDGDAEIVAALRRVVKGPALDALPAASEPTTAPPETAKSAESAQ